VSWTHVRGHEAQVRAFAHVVRRGRLAHAYLFTGPSGIGKRRFAGELARALLCEAPPAAGLEACGVCDACRQVAVGSHPDFFTVGRPEEAAELPVALMRELCRNLSLKPARGRYKIAILDDADDLNDESANTFLKTLEEPPPRSLLILIATSPERQLATIVSRCQVVRFAPLAPALVAEVLQEQGLEDAALVSRLARLSGGSPGQALALAEPALWEFRRTLLEGLTRPQPDAVALARQWTRFLEEGGKEMAGQRRRAALVLRLLIDFLGDALRVSLGGTPQLAEPDNHRFLTALRDRVDPERLLDLLDRCLEGDVQIDRRAQVVLVVEALVDALGQGLRVSP
jgi:DNA polymerase-3 subunit delta'